MNLVLCEETGEWVAGCNPNVVSHLLQQYFLCRNVVALKGYWKIKNRHTMRRHVLGG